MKLYIEDIKEYTEEEANNILSSNKNVAQIHLVDLDNIDINISNLLFEQHKDDYIMVRTEITIDNKRFILCIRFYTHKHWFKKNKRYTLYSIPYRIKNSVPIKNHPMQYSYDELINNIIACASTDDKYDDNWCYYVIDHDTIKYA